MAEPRFQLVTGVARVASPRVVKNLSSRPRAPRAAPELEVSWRLLGSNNREMGRSCRSYAGVDDCHDAVARIKSQLHDLSSRLVIADARGNWRWSLWLLDAEVAASSRVFSRLRECRSNVEQFLEKVPHAAVMSTPVSSMVRRDSTTPWPGAVGARTSMDSMKELL
ncbi:MAG: hypothetical protein WAN48_00135 [Actinomycetes bacterium]